MKAGSRDSAIGILVLLDIIFFFTAVWMSTHGVAEPIDDKIWEAFAGANGALLLILKADSDHPTNPQDGAK